MKVRLPSTANFIEQLWINDIALVPATLLRLKQRRLSISVRRHKLGCAMLKRQQQTKQADQLQGMIDSRCFHRRVGFVINEGAEPFTGVRFKDH